MAVVVLFWPQGQRAQAPANPARPVEAAHQPQTAVPGPGTVAHAEHPSPPSPADWPGLIGYWSFDDGSKTVATDDSSHGNNGTLKDAASTQGVRGQAVRFDGARYLDYGSASTFNFTRNQPFTLAGWVQTTAAAGPILSQRNADQEGPVLDITLENGALVGAVRPDGPARAPIKVWSVRPVNDGRWHHFALVRRPGQMLELYIDGQQQRWFSSELIAGPITTNLRAAASERYWVAHGGGSPHYFQGALDELCIFNRDLNLHEIQRLAGQ